MSTETATPADLHARVQQWIREVAENVPGEPTAALIRDLDAALTQAQALRAALVRLVEQWRETARVVRPLGDAPITSERRQRIAKWMNYTLCADALAAVLKEHE